MKNDKDRKIIDKWTRKYYEVADKYGVEPNQIRFGTEGGFFFCEDWSKFRTEPILSENELIRRNRKKKLEEIDKHKRNSST